MKMLQTASFYLVVAGGLNWLAVGLLQQDLGTLLGGQDNMISRAIYVLVGLAAVMLFVEKKGAVIGMKKGA